MVANNDMSDGDHSSVDPLLEAQAVSPYSLQSTDETCKGMMRAAGVHDSSGRSMDALEQEEVAIWRTSIARATLNVEISDSISTEALRCITSLKEPLEHMI